MPAPKPADGAGKDPAGKDPAGKTQDPARGRGMGDTQAGYDDLAWWTAADDGHDPFPGR